MTMHDAWHQSDDIDWLYMSRKKEKEDSAAWDVELMYQHKDSKTTFQREKKY